MVSANVEMLSPALGVRVPGALLSPYRYPEGFLGTRKLRGPYKEAYQELRKATHSSDDAVERAAERAMANLRAGR